MNLPKNVRPSAITNERRSPTTNPELGHISQQCLILGAEGKTLAFSQKIIKSLYFKHIKVRQDNIKAAHSRTFEWIFKGPHNDPKTPCARFLEWMMSCNGIYWISGKAGSGKSTLMKYLCYEIRTHDALKSWAGSAKLVVATYFFWSAGNAMQKSQQGLLQSLLHQILQQNPELLSVVCSPRWSAEDLWQDDPDPWTLPELFDAFDRLAKLDLSSHKFCLFIDGLDEYDGEHIDLIRIITKISSCPSIKVCASSRPWNVFVEAFGAKINQKLQLQDLTKNDIALYVKDQLREDPRFLKLTEKDNRYLTLVNDIVAKAEGVFLWVFLVVRSILRGLTDDNDIRTLQVRVQHLPGDLNEYFRRMLDTIEDVYQEQTAQIFQVVVQAIRPLSPTTLACLEKDMEDPDYALNSEIQSFTEEEVIHTSQMMRKYVNARCKDLLEVTGCDEAGIMYESQFDVLPPTDTYVRYRVDFLHRTVRDFLRTKDVYNLLQDRTAESFDPRIALCRMLLAQIKGIPETSRGNPQYLMDMVYELLYYAHEVEVYNNSSEVEVLDELNYVLSRFAADDNDLASSLLGDLITHHYDGEAFLAIAVEADLNIYVREKLNASSNFFCGRDRLPQRLLERALIIPATKDYRIQFGNIGPRAETLQMLLSVRARLGIPVENSDRSYEIWHCFLTMFEPVNQEYVRTHQKEVLRIAKLMLQSGIFLDILWREGDRESPEVNQLKKCFSEVFSASQLRQLEICLNKCY
jgi:hypothetical protein